MKEHQQIVHWQRLSPPNQLSLPDPQDGMCGHPCGLMVVNGRLEVDDGLVLGKWPYQVTLDKVKYDYAEL